MMIVRMLDYNVCRVIAASVAVAVIFNVHSARCVISLQVSALMLWVVIVRQDVTLRRKRVVVIPHCVCPYRTPMAMPSGIFALRGA
jgi:hypothetical protein